MDREPPNPLDYATPRPDDSRPHPAWLAVGMALLMVGASIFFIGVGAMSLDFQMGFLDGRSIAFGVVGAVICGIGMKVKDHRPSE